MWKPACSVTRYLPSRSTMYALCCGTTTAVLAITKITRMARTTKTTSVSVMTLSLRLLRPDVEREAVHAHHAPALPPGERAGVHVVRRPRAAAQLGLADRARRE